MSFGKIYQSIYDGTLGEHWQALVTFEQMLVLGDAEGVLDMTPLALHKRTGIPLRIIQAGLVILEAPDPSSRTPDEEGRRIVRLDAHRDWGWKIVNHRQYRDLREASDRRDYHREYYREHRSKAALNQTQPDSTALNSPQPDSTNTEAEAEADTNTTTTNRGPFEKLRLLVSGAPDRWQIVEFVEARQPSEVWAKAFVDWLEAGMDLEDGKPITVSQLGRTVRDLATKPRADQESMAFVRGCANRVIREDRRNGQRRGSDRPGALAGFKAPDRRKR